MAYRTISTITYTQRKFKIQTASVLKCYHLYLVEYLLRSSTTFNLFGIENSSFLCSLLIFAAIPL